MLYNLAVGLERLLKVAVVLIEHDKWAKQEKLEESLITHTHSELLQRIRSVHKINFGPPHNSLLDLLARFYNTHRYGRYCLASIQTTGAEKVEFHAFLKKYLNGEIGNRFIWGTHDGRRFCEFLERTVLRITTAIYELIHKEAARLNLNTYDVRPDSKAGKVFLDEEPHFEDEDRLWKELLIFFMKSKKETGHFKLLKSLEPLNFDPALAADYLQCFASHEKKVQVLSEMESLWDKVLKVSKRWEVLDAIGDSSACFDDEEEDGDDSDLD